MTTKIGLKTGEWCIIYSFPSEKDENINRTVQIIVYTKGFCFFTQKLASRKIKVFSDLLRVY